MSGNRQIMSRAASAGRLGILALCLFILFSILLARPAQAQAVPAYSQDFEGYALPQQLTIAQTGGASTYWASPNGTGPNGNVTSSLNITNLTQYLEFWTNAGLPAYNAASYANRVFYSFTSAVSPNNQYRFSMREVSLSLPNQTTTNIYANGTLIGTMTPNAITWTSSSFNWNSGAATSVKIELVDANAAPGALTSGDDFAIDDLKLSALADPSVTKTDGVASVAANSSTTYTLTVTNSGAGVTGLVLSDPAVAGLTKTIVSCSATPGQCVTPPTIAQLQAGTFTLPFLAPGQTYQLRVTALVTAASGATVTNAATITPPAGIVDTNTGNNSSSDADTVTASSADLAITKTDGVTAVAAGGSTVYTVTVTNNGPSTVTGAILKDAAVTALTKTAIACSASPGQCTGATTPTITQIQSAGGYALPALASGQTYQMTVTAFVTAGSGSVANVATIDIPSGTTDSVSGNNSATDTDTVISIPLTISKTAAVFSDPVNGTTNPKSIPGAFVDYMLTIANPSPLTITADTIVVSDQLPGQTGLFVNAVSPSAGPIVFTSLTSGLTFTYASLGSTTDDLDFSSDNGATWTRTPVADANGVDATITNIRVKPKGAMAPNSSFTIRFRAAVK